MKSLVRSSFFVNSMKYPIFFLVSFFYYFSFMIVIVVLFTGFNSIIYNTKLEFKRIIVLSITLRKNSMKLNPFIFLELQSRNFYKFFYLKNQTRRYYM